MNSIAVGLCQCGCGQKTRIATRTNNWAGQTKGVPLRYVNNHHSRKSPVEYVVEDRGHTTLCWIWQRAMSPDGYGKKFNEYAHRAYFEEKYGSIQAGKQLDHLCRVPACCNPDHLEPVTPAENVQRSAKVRGMTAGDIVLIRRLVYGGMSVTTCGRMFNRHYSTISKIVSRDTWANIEHSSQKPDDSAGDSCEHSQIPDTLEGVGAKG